MDTTPNQQQPFLLNGMITDVLLDEDEETETSATTPTRILLQQQRSNDDEKSLTPLSFKSISTSSSPTPTSYIIGCGSSSSSSSSEVPNNNNNNNSNNSPITNTTTTTTTTSSPSTTALLLPTQEEFKMTPAVACSFGSPGGRKRRAPTEEQHQFNLNTQSSPLIFSSFTKNNLNPIIPGALLTKSALPPPPLFPASSTVPSQSPPTLVQDFFSKETPNSNNNNSNAINWNIFSTNENLISNPCTPFTIERDLEGVSLDKENQLILTTPSTILIPSEDFSSNKPINHIIPNLFEIQKSPIHSIVQKKKGNVNLEEKEIISKIVIVNNRKKEEEEEQEKEKEKAAAAAKESAQIIVNLQQQLITIKKKLHTAEAEHSELLQVLREADTRIKQIETDASKKTAAISVENSSRLREQSELYSRLEYDYMRARVSLQDTTTELAHLREECSQQKNLLSGLQADLMSAEDAAMCGRDYTQKRLDDAALEVSKCHMAYRREISSLRAQLMMAEQARVASELRERATDARCTELSKISDELLSVLDGQVQDHDRLWAEYISARGISVGKGTTTTIGHSSGKVSNQIQALQQQHQVSSSRRSINSSPPNTKLMMSEHHQLRNNDHTSFLEQSHSSDNSKLQSSDATLVSSGNLSSKNLTSECQNNLTDVETKKINVTIVSKLPSALPRKVLLAPSKLPFRQNPSQTPLRIKNTIRDQQQNVQTK